MKKKILFVITKSNWGGAQRYVFDLSTALPDSFDTAVALGGTGGKHEISGILAQRLSGAGVRTILIRSFMRDISPFGDIQATRELVGLFRTEKPDIVHLNSSKAGGLGALAARIAGVKRVIFTSHGLAWDENRNVFARGLIFVTSWATFLLSHKVIVLSHNNYKRARRLPFCKKKIVLIHNGIPMLPFKTREEARYQLSTSLRPASNEIWIGAIGELTRNKGYEYLIEAMSLLKKEEKKPVLYILGIGEDEARLKTKIRQSGLENQVYLMGFISQAWQLLKAFDIFVLASVKEGLPYVLLEAGQAGIATVGSKIPGTEDIIKHGESGLLFKSKNAHDLARQLNKLIGDGELRGRLAGELQSRIAKDFSNTRMVEKTTALYI